MRQTMTKTVDTQTLDEKRGYRDRIAGYYDKWYRYNRQDDGAAYDRGCVRAINSGRCPEYFTLIDCVNNNVERS